MAPSWESLSPVPILMPLPASTNLSFLQRGSPRHQFIREELNHTCRLWRKKEPAHWHPLTTPQHPNTPCHASPHLISAPHVALPPFPGSKTSPPRDVRVLSIYVDQELLAIVSGEPRFEDAELLALLTVGERSDHSCSPPTAPSVSALFCDSALHHTFSPVPSCFCSQGSGCWLIQAAHSLLLSLPRPSVHPPSPGNCLLPV